MCDLVNDEVDEVYLSQYACIHGLQYKEGCALVEKYDGFTPIICCCSEYYCAQSCKVLRATVNKLHLQAAYSILCIDTDRPVLYFAI